MSINLNSILAEAGLDIASVRLLRHKDNRAVKGCSPYNLWRDDREKFELYQSVQDFPNRKKLQADYWVVFVVTPADETMFVGVYKMRYLGVADRDIPKQHAEGVDPAGTCDLYDLQLQDTLQNLSGRLIINWGAGERAWIQRADRQNKTVLELRTAFQEPEFPGFLSFVEQLSQLQRLPKGWITALCAAKGIYLLTCPKTKEQYVGSATGEHGFWQRWLEYAQTGHGNNVALKSREPSDYQVAILEVAGTAATMRDILAREVLWKRKLQSQEMGLNRN